jgi:homoaconitase/3-isopropylmalate dehydratase large subunit
LTVAENQSATQQLTSATAADVNSVREILKDHSLTFAEKALSINNQGPQEGKRLNAGDIAIVDVDLAMAQDSTGPLAIKSIKEMRIDKLYDP